MVPGHYIHYLNTDLFHNMKMQKYSAPSLRLLLLFLIGLTIIAFFLRFFLISQNLFFGPEQGRDFLVIKKIVVDHDITLIGSKTDIDGVFHGPIFYYLATIPFLISGGDPVFVSAFFILLQALTVPLVFLLGKNLFNTRVGVISAVLFCFSYSAIAYARWLSNPPLSIPFSVLFFLALFYYLKKDKRYLFAVALSFGALVQIQFLNLVFFSGILFVVLLLFFKRIKETSWIVLLGSVMLLIASSIGNFILFDLRHDYLITKNVLALTAGKSGFYVSLVTSILLTITTFSNFFGKTIMPFLSNSWLILALVFIFGRILVSKKTLKESKTSLLLLFVWILIPVIILIVLRHDVLFHFFIPLIVPMIMIVSGGVERILKWNTYVGFGMLCLFIVVNLYFYRLSIPFNKYTFFQDTQPDLKYADQQYVINKIYIDSNGETFSFQSYTIPYWSQQAWKYLFWYSGEKKYGFYPLPEKATYLYVIIQDNPGQFQEDWLKYTVSKWGEQVGEFRKGVITVRKLRVP